MQALEAQRLVDVCSFFSPVRFLLYKHPTRSMRLSVFATLLALAVSRSTSTVVNGASQETLSGALQHNFNELLSDLRELGSEYGFQIKDANVADATPLVLLIGGFSTGVACLLCIVCGVGCCVSERHGNAGC